MPPRFQVPRPQRWAVAAIVILGLVSLGDLSLAMAEQPPALGVRARQAGEGLIVSWVQPGGLAWDVGVRPGDRIIAVDGRPVVATDTPSTVASASQIMTESSDGLIRTVPSRVLEPLTLSRLHRLAFIAIAASFSVVGVLIYVLAGDAIVGAIALGFSVAGAVLFFSLSAVPSGADWAVMACHAAALAFAAGALLLFLAFPVDRLRTPRGRWLATGCLSVTTVLLAAYGWTYFFRPAAYEVLRPVTYAALISEMVGAGALLVAGLLATPAERRDIAAPLSVVTVGAFVALAPPVCLILVPSLLDIGSIVRPEIALLSLMALPASLGTAVLSRRFFGITRILRRGLVALLVWMALIGSYTAGFVALARWSSGQNGPIPVDLAAPAVTVALVAATFWPLQHRLRRALERRLFRDVYDYRATLRELSAELVQFGELSAVARHALDRLGRTLDLSWAAIELTAEPEPLRFRWEGDTVIAAPDDGGQQVIATSPAAYQVPLIADGETIGTLQVGAKRHDIDLLPEDRELIATVAPHLATALRNALLIRQLEAQVEALADRERTLATLNDRLLSVQEEERRRLALDLHDDPLQRAIQLSRELGAWVNCPRAERWQEIVEDIIASLRAICDGLHPPVLDDFGLPAGLEWLAARLRAETDLDVQVVIEAVNGDPFGRLEPDLELALYRVAQEALNNCLKHAEARSITVTLRREPARVLLRVADDGRGPAANGTLGGSQVGLGLLGMRERLQRWQGRVTLEGGQPRGAVLTAEVRLGEAHGDETNR